MRWMVLLACQHNLATDEVPDLETAELCPECRTYERVVGTLAFNDEDVFAPADPPKADRVMQLLKGWSRS